MKEMQMTAIVLTAAMTAILLWQLPKRVEADAVTNRSRRLITLALRRKQIRASLRRKQILHPSL